MTSQHELVEIDPSLFRHILGHLPTGVTVITAFGGDGPAGMAANSVVSVSLEPPLILFCPGKTSETWPKIREVGSFCVNVMAGHHEEVVRAFAAKETDRFSGVQLESRATGPALPDAVAWLDCTMVDEHDGGDHTIVVARVVALDALPEAEPLVFFRGTYGGFSPPAPPDT
jgi:flavin reductase (DIM6/NTAB) family NADH-FMN oxidoreductase RutF